MHATVCDYLADLVQNAIEAGAMCITLNLRTGKERWVARVRDNGKGMDMARLAQARDPFFTEPGKHDRRRVGLGLPLLDQAVTAMGGALRLRSRPGVGTSVTFCFNPAHIDAPPLGNLPSTLSGLMTFEGGYDLIVRRAAPAGCYRISRNELIHALDNLVEAENIQLATRYIASQEASLKEPT
jgi:hypothetical protein